MGLNIKNEEAHRLARELAELTGESLTTAVTEALRERLARARAHGLAERLVAIGKANARRLRRAGKAAPGKDPLHDAATGLPR